MTLTKQYFTTTEALEDILDVLESGYDGSMEDLHHEVFNTDYYITGTYQAKQALTEYGVFEAIDVVQEYEDNAFGARYTDVSDPEKLANMLYYIIGEEVIQAGDRLILAVGNDFKNKENISKNFYLLSDIEKNQKYTAKQSIFVILGFISIILTSALGYISLFKALIIALIVLLFSKLLTINDIKRNFPFEIFLIIGSSIAISKVLANSGLANDIATVITASFGVYGVYGSFIGIYLVTMILTEFMSNNSAAAIVFPIAYSTAIGLDVSIYPFVFAVAFGASASFLIPHGYQTNLMVTSLGSYKTKDFIKAGIPLSIVYSLVVIIATPIFFKF